MKVEENLHQPMLQKEQQLKQVSNSRITGYIKVKKDKMQEKKKNPDQGKVGEMGKPSLKSKFEAAMQEQYMSRPENKKKDSKPSVNVKRVMEVIKKRKGIQTEMGGKDNSEKFEGAMQKAFMSRFKN
jgi:hypothetical protein